MGAIFADRPDPEAARLLVRLDDALAHNRQIVELAAEIAEQMQVPDVAEAIRSRLGQP